MHRCNGYRNKQKLKMPKTTCTIYQGNMHKEAKDKFKIFTKQKITRDRCSNSHTTSGQRYKKPLKTINESCNTYNTHGILQWVSVPESFSVSQ